MPYIKLTETDYVAAEDIEIIRQMQSYGQPCVEVIMKRQDLCELNFRGDEAAEAWGNWQAYMREAEARRRGAAEAALPMIEPCIKSEDNEK
jgi:hypothetical protein